MDALLAHEGALRLYLLVGAFAVVALWEAVAPRRLPMPAAGWRWTLNIGLTILLSVVVGALFPLVAVGAAFFAERHGFGLLRMAPLPAPVAFGIALVALDLARYAEHALLHRVPLLWRLHRVHHSDTQYDCTTALRFHPVEALVTVGLQMLAVIALGASPAAVLVFEALAIVMALFAHGNVRLAAPVDRLLRGALVTPDMHRVHHSAFVTESGRNFGAVLTWWDRLFRTYQAQPAHGHDRMAIGLADVDERDAASLAWLLAAPFLPDKATAPASSTR